MTNDRIESTNGTVEQKPVKPVMRRFLGIAGFDDDAIIRGDRRRVSVIEFGGVTVNGPNLGGFAQMMNGIDFPFQLLIRQHQPNMNSMAEEMLQRRKPGMTDKLNEAAETHRNLILSLNEREGVFDRRFYFICDEVYRDRAENAIDQLTNAWMRLRGNWLTEFVFSCVTGESPAQGIQTNIEARERARDVEINGKFRRHYALKRWPRALTPMTIQQLFTVGVRMDITIHVSPADTAVSVRKLEHQKSKMETMNRITLEKTGTSDPEADLAIEDVDRLRDLVQRGAEKLFDTSIIVAAHAKDRDSLKAEAEQLETQLNSTMAKLDTLRYRQIKAMRSLLPLNYNQLREYRAVDTSSLMTLFPVSPPDLDRRHGSLIGFDRRSQTPVIYDIFDGTFMNMNTCVLARSGAGKSFSTKLNMLRNLTQGVACYVIDPEGEYVDMAIAAGGRVIIPGVEGMGLNPFVIHNLSNEDFQQRIFSLNNLIQVMVGDRMSPIARSALDAALTEYYEQVQALLDTPTTGLFTWENQEEGQPDFRMSGVGFKDFCNFLQKDGQPEPYRVVAAMLSPFYSGSLKHLLSDEGEDLLNNEASITVFDLHRLESQMKPVAATVCSETVWSVAMRDPKPRLLVVDEVWSMMQSAEGSGFIVSMAKRARKHKLGLWAITQDVQDLLTTNISMGIDGNAGRALLQNSACKLLLRQDPAISDTVAETFDLPDSIVRWLISSPRGSGLLISDEGNFPISIEATPEETEIIEWQPGRESSHIRSGVAV